MLVADFSEIKVLYVPSDTGIQGAKKAFDTLESKLSTLRHRKFYGLVFGIPPNEEYWACVALTSDDNPEKMGLQTGTIPGGRYVQQRVNDWDEHPDLIGKTFQSLASQHAMDSSRPGIEFYRSMRDMRVRLPIT